MSLEKLRFYFNLNEADRWKWRKVTFLLISTSVIICSICENRREDCKKFTLTCFVLLRICGWDPCVRYGRGRSRRRRRFCAKS